jgi:hypothetical protein
MRFAQAGQIRAFLGVCPRFCAFGAAPSLALEASSHGGAEPNPEAALGVSGDGATADLGTELARRPRGWGKNDTSKTRIFCAFLGLFEDLLRKVNS